MIVQIRKQVEIQIQVKQEMMMKKKSKIYQVMNWRDLMKKILEMV